MCAVYWCGTLLQHHILHVTAPDLSFIEQAFRLLWFLYGKYLIPVLGSCSTNLQVLAFKDILPLSVQIRKCWNLPNMHQRDFAEQMSFRIGIHGAVSSWPRTMPWPHEISENLWVHWRPYGGVLIHDRNKNVPCIPTLNVVPRQTAVSENVTSVKLDMDFPKGCSWIRTWHIYTSRLCHWLAKYSASSVVSSISFITFFLLRFIDYYNLIVFRVWMCK